MRGSKYGKGLIADAANGETICTSIVFSHAAIAREKVCIIGAGTERGRRPIVNSRSLNINRTCGRTIACKRYLKSTYKTVIKIGLIARPKRRGCIHDNVGHSPIA